MELSILFRDENLVVVAKPSGLAVHRGWARDPETVVQLAQRQLGRKVYPIHRLDRPTSGALVLGLSADVARFMQHAMGEGRFGRTYLALVRGIPPESGVVDYPLRTRPDRDLRRPAASEYRRLFVFRERYALVEVRPQSGRYHQVRRHMKAMSWHVIGDVLYGKGEHNRLFRTEYGLHRLALHARAVSFPEVATTQAREVIAPLPADLAIPFEAIGIPRPLWADDGV